MDQKLIVANRLSFIIDDLILIDNLLENCELHNEIEELSELQKGLNNNKILLKEPFADSIASGYEFHCPLCNHMNTHHSYEENVNCTNCNFEFKVIDPIHCYG